MIIKRKEKWWHLIYDTNDHKFIYKILNMKGIPYMTRPIILNVDLTFKCNMKCSHCVAKDMEILLNKKGCTDLIITENLLFKINKSPFMVVVITGGEPLLPDYEDSLIRLIKGLKNKGIIIDTNGSIIPSSDVIKIFKEKDVLVRVSWDIPSPKEEAILRAYPKSAYKSDLEYLKDKEKIIKYFLKNEIKVAIQSVMHKYNYKNNNFYDFPYKLRQLGIEKWYVQRFIPSYKNKKDAFDSNEYEVRISKIINICKEANIECYSKRDRRHNSVFLLVRDGELYTQSDERAGEKIYLGKIEEIDYFEYVSAPDHSARYLF